MIKIVSRLTVLFQDPFWVGIYERQCCGRYEVCKVTFGAEPKDFEVYDFLLRNYSWMRFSPAIMTAEAAERRMNPKRLQRLIQKQVQAGSGVATKAQEALKLQQEQQKLERKSFSREEREAENSRLYLLRREKQKEKHRGR